ncbi:MAG: MerR family transcriptional regulator [Deltaproteobacteria bacterium]|nr:MerR family transcriptional regulator [Deltaproteobacteria bacterium]
MRSLTLVPETVVPSSTSTSSAARDLLIGDLAKATGKTQRALRLYEELGLLTPGDHTAGGFRLYGPEAITRVHWIGKLQELGFTLQQIQGLVAAVADEAVPKEAMGKVRALFLQKLDDVAAQIARLSQLQRELMSSLSYLEECGGCDTHATAGKSGAASCTTCTSHDDKAPPLVDETTRCSTHS